MKKFFKNMFVVLILLILQGNCWEINAQDVSMREIKDMLHNLDKKVVILNTGQDAINQRIDEINNSLNQRIDEINNSLNQRIDDLNNSLNQRIDDLSARINTQFVVLMMLIVALFGYIIWDRRTVLKPLVEKIELIETEIGLKEEKGSKIRRLIETLKELAKEDRKLAEVLKNFNLL